MESSFLLGGVTVSHPQPSVQQPGLGLPGKPVPTKKQPSYPYYIYCEICRIRCNHRKGYLDHLAGQKHRKKEAALALEWKLDGTDKTSKNAVSETVVGMHSSQSVKKADAVIQSSEFIGLEFIEEVRDESGVIVSYNCRLCSCLSMDLNAKDSHLKGRRHRIQYKNKVDSTLKVKAKPNSGTAGIREGHPKKQQAKESYRIEQDFLPGKRLEQSEAVNDYELRSKPRKSSGAFQITVEDHCLLTKHLSLYPSTEEMADIHNAIVSFENALKLVSDIILTEDMPIKMGNSSHSAEPIAAPNAVKIKAEIEPDVTEASKDKTTGAQELNQDVEPEAYRVLKGVVRVGPLSKGLLIHGDLVEHLVIICSERPTRSLLQRILDLLPTQIEVLSEKKFTIGLRFEESGLIVKVDAPSASFVVTLTSAPGKESVVVKSDELLSQEHCSSALAHIRRTKWFQEQLGVFKAGTVVTHVLRDLCKRNAVWSPLSEWAQELLVEKCLFTAGLDTGPGKLFRTVLECISSCNLLPGGHGLMDPCEETSTDATVELTNQQRQDITVSAKHFLWLFECHQIYKILGEEPDRHTFKRRNDSQDINELEIEQKRPREEE